MVSVRNQLGKPRGNFGQTPAAVSWAPDRIDLFDVDAISGSMQHKAWSGSAWFPSLTSWEDLGGYFYSGPAAVSWGSGRLDVFGVGTTGGMYHKAWTGSGWSPTPSRALASTHPDERSDDGIRC